MTEDEFIQSIDCCFPYFDEPEWKRLIKTGAAISPNSSFAVLYEICRPGRSVKATPEHLKSIADIWANQFQHPLSDRVYNVALKHIKGEGLSIQETLDLFNEVKKFKDQYCALAIIYFSCDDPCEQLESAYDNIVKEWRSA